MRETRSYSSEGGEGSTLPDPYLLQTSLRSTAPGGHVLEA